MIGLLHLVILCAASVLLFFSLFLLAEVVAAVTRRDEKALNMVGARGNCAVIIPAHNEQSGIADTIRSVQGQINDTDRIIVVADNCTDDTAKIALAAGAEVLQRTDEIKRGKGYALQFALDNLQANAPVTAVFVDADCVCGDGAIDTIAYRAEHDNLPIQALYLMAAPEGGDAKSMLSAFAWTFMNAVRMNGLDRIFKVTRLTGSGFALPWRIAKDLHIGSDEIVEDLALTLTLTRLGEPPRLCRNAIITSVLPKDEKAAATQHARWEHGSIRLATHEGPKLFFHGITHGDWRCVALAIDIMIPPLTLFGAAIGMTTFLALIIAFVGAGNAFANGFAASMFFAVSVFLGWWSFGRVIAPPAALGAMVGYVLSKLKVYDRSARASTKEWTRTERDEDDNA